MERALTVAFVGVAAYLQLAPAAVNAQDIDLNYDALSSLEEPLAIPLGDVTLSLTGLLDAPLIVDLEQQGDEEIEPGLIANFQIGVQTQLGNRWRVGAAYFGQYATRAFASFDNEDGYSDNVAGFVGTSLGTLAGGNVAGQVRELTRRKRGVGNAALGFDLFYGEIDNWGGAYFGRFGPTLVAVAIDDNGDFELGGSFQRPIGHYDYRFSARFVRARFQPDGHPIRFRTIGIAGVAESTYGSSIFDIGVGYEKLDSSIIEADRWYISGGLRTQIGALRLSGEGHYGRLTRGVERSASFGAAYMIARGLSLNYAVNYRETRVTPLELGIAPSEEIQSLVSIRFSF